MKVKRAIVGLVEPFYFPEDEPDMSEGERKEWEDKMTSLGKAAVHELERLPVVERINKARSQTQPKNGSKEDREVMSALELERKEERRRERLESVDEGVIDELAREGK